jgi:hypothetical protein
LFIRHGQQCFKCRKATRPGTDEWKEAPDCPLEHLLVRDKEEAKAKPPRKRKIKDDDELEDDDNKQENAKVKPRNKRQKVKAQDESGYDGMEDVDEDAGLSDFVG